ncbi:MAG: hypothetical protein JSV80_11965, partial [Acidobacteriota bacterium]
VLDLIEAGFRYLDQVINADLEDLTRVEGIDVDLALHIHDQAETLLPVVREEEEEARRLAEELAAAREQAEAEEIDVHGLLATADDEPVDSGDVTQYPDDESSESLESFEGAGQAEDLEKATGPDGEIADSMESPADERSENDAAEVEAVEEADAKES